MEAVFFFFFSHWLSRVSSDLLQLPKEVILNVTWVLGQVEVGQEVVVQVRQQGGGWNLQTAQNSDVRTPGPSEQTSQLISFVSFTSYKMISYLTNF